MPANGWCLVHKIDLKTGSGEIKGSLNPTYPTANDHHISDLAIVHIFYPVIARCIL